MNKYDSYKDSGIEWIGKIPSHWKVTKLKFIGNIICGGTPSTTNEEYWTGNIPWIQSGKVQNNIVLLDVVDKKITENALVESSTKLVKKDSVLIAITGATCSNIGYLTFETAVNQSIVAVEPSNFNSVLLFNLLKSQKEQILFHQSGGAQGGVTKGDMMNIYIPYPTVEEQITIANYLDQKTTQIDDLIAKKENLIRLQEEERTAMINQAVTKGLDPTVPMKDSGIEWLGEIPAHWEVKRIGHVTKVVRGASPRPAGDPFLFNGDFLPWITVKEVTNAEGKYIVSTETCLTEEGSKNTRIIEPETLLLSNSGATLGVPRITKIKGGINDGSVAFFNLQIERDYLYYFFITHTKIYREEVSGYGQPNLNTDIVKSTKIALPNKKEQLKIVIFIEKHLEKFEDLKIKTQQEIELLKEYKTVLISEVVTGKVDVRNE
jgi:type I restriction enzyme S subunit